MEAKHEKISFTLVEHKLFKRVSAFRLEVSVTNDLPEKLNFRVKMKNGIEIDESEGEMQHSYDILQILYTRGLKLKLVGGLHSRDKMLRGPKFIRKSFCGPQFTGKALNICLI